LVTGGSKGIGRGIALQLGKAGATVYVTGRTQKDLDTCAAAIREAGGEPKTLVVDHGKDDEVKALFERIRQEQNGKLDVLVNNAYAAVTHILDNMGKPFWEIEPERGWDIVNNVGLRNHYLCTTYASRMMVPRKSGLIVNVSSIGGLISLFNVAYGIGKAAVDKMSVDCAKDLKRHNVAMVGLWPGAVRTETMTEKVLDDPNAAKASKKVFEDGESIEFAGKAVAALAADPDHIRKTGKILLTADLAREYSFVDDNGRITGEMRSVSKALEKAGWTTLAACVPDCVRIPHVLFYLMGYKF